LTICNNWFSISEPGAIALAMSSENYGPILFMILVMTLPFIAVNSFISSLFVIFEVILPADTEVLLIS